MDEFRSVRRLKREIEIEYNIENGYELAVALVNSGITDMADDIREKISYLQQICKEVAFDDYWFAALVSEYSLEDIKTRYKRYEKYVASDTCEIGCLAFTSEKEVAYVSLLSELGLTKEQIASAMKMIVEQGSIVKSEEDAKHIIEELNIFGIDDAIRNQFVSDNADFLFNDYSREAYKVFELLCRKYGKEDGFVCLKEHPEYIRLGVKNTMLSEGIE